MKKRTLAVLLACGVLVCTAGRASAGFDLNAIPAAGVGDKAWTVERNTLCSSADQARAERFARSTKRLVAEAARTPKVSRRALTPSITARYERWGTSYVVVFALARPMDLDWLANCFRVGGADLDEAHRRGLHTQAAPLNAVDLEFSPDVGLYYLVHAPGAHRAP